MGTELTVVKQADAIESALIGGDLSKLNLNDRLNYYNQVCESLGLNPLTQPFSYITLNGKLTLYAKRDCAEQLRNSRGVSITQLDKVFNGDLYIVTAYAKDKTGKTDVSTGAVSVKGLGGENLANAIMKAETKAKRRVTLSICGLGLLDETEVASIPGAQPEQTWATPDDKQAIIDRKLKELKAEPKDEEAPELEEITRWKTVIGACITADDFNALLPKVKDQPTVVKMALMTASLDKGLKFDKETKCFVRPANGPSSPEKPSESNPGAKAGHPVRPSSPASTNGTSGSVSGKTQETFLRPTQTIEPLADVQTGLEEVDAEIREVTVKDVEQRRKGGRVYMLLSCTVAGHEGIQPIICWHKNSMFDHLSKSMGKVCKFGVVREEKGDEVFYNLEEIHSIGDQVFVDNKPELTAAQLGFVR